MERVPEVIRCSLVLNEQIWEMLYNYIIRPKFFCDLTADARKRQARFMVAQPIISLGEEASTEPLRMLSETAIKPADIAVS